MEIYKLPVYFDQARLQKEVAQFDVHEWIAHPTQAAGDASVPLVSVGGTCNLDYAISGPMQPTSILGRCPYLKQVMQTFNRPLSRCRLLRLASNTETPPCADYSYHAFRRDTIYVPILTYPDVKFVCHGQEVHMSSGTAWTFDWAQRHWMVNPNSRDCVHLVVESKSSHSFDLQHSQECPLPYKPDQDPDLAIEPYSFEVLTPQEIDSLTTEILAAVTRHQIPAQALQSLTDAVAEFCDRWEKQYDRFGHQSTGELAYLDLIEYFFTPRIAAKANKWLSNAECKGKQAVEVIRSMLFTSRRAVPKPKNLRVFLGKQRRKIEAAKTSVTASDFVCPEFARPIFIVSAPRAGSTLLFETLAHFSELWTIGEESHELIEAISELHPAAHNYHSNSLTVADAQPHITTDLRTRFAQQLQNRDAQKYSELPTAKRPDRVRLLEKTPKNALRIPFLKAVFPEARFLFLYREPAANISSMMEGWRAQRFVPYPSLPGWPYREWNFLLVPGWQSLVDRPVADIAAYQWQMANATILDDLDALPASDWTFVRYTDLIREPKPTIQRIAEFAELRWDDRVEQRVSQSLPTSSMTLSAPAADKWRKHAWQLDPFLPALEPVIRQVDAVEELETMAPLG